MKVGIVQDGKGTCLLCNQAFTGKMHRKLLLNHLEKVHNRILLTQQEEQRRRGGVLETVGHSFHGRYVRVDKLMPTEAWGWR